MEMACDVTLIGRRAPKALGALSVLRGVDSPLRPNADGTAVTRQVR